MSAKTLMLHLCKWLGLFQIARVFQRSGLRILCYHGFAINDEYDFRPKLFICPRTFERRLRYLAANHFPVISLEEGLEGLRDGNLPPGATVITIDDGFYSVLRCAAPLLESYSFPATVYVTTYYSVKETPVFRLVIQYMFWKTPISQLDMTEFVTPVTGLVSWNTEAEKDRVMWDIIRFGETQLSEAQRSELAAGIGRKLRVSYEHIARQRTLSLLTPSEIHDLAEDGFNVQLHTHRHRLPDDELSICREITDNRAVLEPITERKLEHLCYPSGIWSENSWRWLTAMGVKSAVTCDPGLNTTRTASLALRRFLDGENIEQIEFEAELCGFSDLLRSIRSLMRRPTPVAQTAAKDAPYAV